MALFCIPLLPEIREESEPRGVEAFAYLDDISIVMPEITPSTVMVVLLLRPRLCESRYCQNPLSKTLVLPPKGHVPPPKETALLEGIGVRTGEGSGVKVVGVPTGNGAFAVNSTRGDSPATMGEKSNSRAFFRVCMPDKQSANIIATSSMVQRTSHIERVKWTRSCHYPRVRRANTSATWMLELLLSSFQGQRIDRRSEQPHSRGAPEVPEPLTIRARYLTRYNTSEKFVRATRPALVCASPKTNTWYMSKFFILAGGSSLKGTQLVRDLWPKKCNPYRGMAPL